MASDKRPLSVQTRALLPSESRAPRLATRTMRYTTPGSPMWPAWDGDSAFERAYYGTVYVHRAVQYLASTIAGLPFRAGAKLPMSPTGTAPSNDTAPLAKLLGPPPLGPNPITSARQLWAWSVAQFLVTGKICWENELATGASKQVLGLWPIPGQYVAPIPTAGGDQFFAGFRVTSVGALPVDLPVERLTYCWRPSQRDWRQPESVLEAASLPVSVQILLDRYSWAFLKNNAVPSTLVITPGFEEAEERRGFRDQFSGEFTGVDNAGKTMFLETEPEDDTGLATGVQGRPLVQVERLGQTAQDAQLLELRHEMIRDVAIAFGVPMSKLGDASGRTFANAAEEDKTTWNETILPLCLDLADQINLHLAPKLGGEVGWFDLSGVEALKGPEKVQQVGAPSLVSGGIATQNEMRAEIGLPPVDGGDQLINPLAAQLLQSGFIPPGVDVGEVKPQPSSTPPPPKEEPPVLTVVRSTREVPPAIDHQARRTSEWRKVDRQVTAVEGPMAQAMRKLFKAQAKAVLARLEGKRGRQMFRSASSDVAAIFDRKHWQAETASAVEPFHAALQALAVNRVDAALPRRAATPVEATAAALKERRSKLAETVTATTYDELVDQLAAGVKEGEGIPDLAARVAHVFDVADTARSVRVARTEVVGAFAEASYSYAAGLGDVIEGNEWISTRDSRTRESHAEVDGEVRPTGEAFSNGLLHPGDLNAPASETCNCRCTIGPVIAGEGGRSKRSNIIPLAEALARLERVTA